MKNNQLSKLYKEYELPKRVDKALAWLADSRDKWKEKCMETKLKLKRQMFATNRARDSRDEWRLRNVRLKQELIKSEQKINSLLSHIDELESHIDGQKQEIHQVKKKR